MNNKLEVLNAATGRNFEEVVCNGKKNENYFKCDWGEGFVIEREKSQAYIEEAILSEIPYLDNIILKDSLPEKYNCDAILNDLKELAKFDHTIISNFLNNKAQFYLSVTARLGYNDFFLDGSAQILAKKDDVEYEVYVTRN